MKSIPQEIDVVIVGAGLAGLTAADQLVQSGYGVVVLEGRNRVGGRIRTTEVAGFPVDAGATWVAPDHAALRDLARRLGCQFIPQFDTGKGVISFGGKRRVESATALAPWVMLDLARVMKALQEMADSLPVHAPWEHPDAHRLDAISLGEWLSSRWALGDTRKFLTMFSRVHWGAPPGDVSLFHCLRYIRSFGSIDVMLKVKGGDQQDRILGTAHGLVNKFADTLGARVVTGASVERITTVGDRATVDTARQKIACRYVIVTASPVHRSTIEFMPALPDQHYGLARSWRLGSLSKAFVAYPQPFWRGAGLSGSAVSDDDTVFLTFDVSPDSPGPGILMVFCDGRGFDGYPADERRTRVLRQLRHLYGDDASRPIDYVDFCWGNDVVAPGGPNPAPGPNAWTSFGRFLREPVGLVHWAGTETADAFSGTMNGAILSGKRAAEEVKSRLMASMSRHEVGGLHLTPPGHAESA